MKRDVAESNSYLAYKSISKASFCSDCSIPVGGTLEDCIGNGAKFEVGTAGKWGNGAGTAISCDCGGACGEIICGGGLIGVPVAT